MTVEAVKEILAIPGMVEISNIIPMQIKEVLPSFDGHVFACLNKDEWINANLSEYSEEELSEMTQEEITETFFQFYFGIAFTNVEYDPDLEDIEGGIVLFPEDVYDNPEEIFDDISKNWIWEAIIWHEIGHIIHHTDDELVADTEAIVRMGMDKEKELKFYSKLKRLSAELGYSMDDERYSHRNV